MHYRNEKNCKIVLFSVQFGIREYATELLNKSKLYTISSEYSLSIILTTACM